MAFNKAILQANIVSIFRNMTDKATNSDFANNLSNAIVTFVSTGKVSTDDGGTITGGVFTGSGSGTLTVTATTCAKTILDACDYMNTKSDDEHFNGADYLAEQMGNGLKQMADDGQVVTSVIGKLVTQSTTVDPYGGSAEGTISCNADSFVSALKNIFSQMYAQKDNTSYDGNLEFAKKLADEINTFWTSGNIQTNGIGNLSGSQGIGSIT